MDLPEYGVTVEVLIDADVDTVFNAILDANNFHRWMPDGEVRIRGEHRILQKGSEIDVKLNRLGTLRWTEKVVDIVENKIVRLEYIEGDYLGELKQLRNTQYSKINT